MAGDPADVQIMYGIGGERRLEERELDGSRATRARRPCGSGTPPRRSSSSTSTARCSTRCTRRGSTARRPTTTSGRCPKPARLARGRLAAGGLGASGRCAAPPGTSRTRRSWPGSRSTAPCARRGIRARGPIDRWREIRDEIKDEVLARGWSDAKQSFTQSYGSDALDASALADADRRLPPCDRPADRVHRRGIRARALVDGLVLRYRPADEGVDGLPGGEGVFLACSFWLVEVLALQGRGDEATRAVRAAARAAQRRRTARRGVRPAAGRQLGNFPQAFTHLALVGAAIALGEGRGIRDGT